MTIEAPTRSEELSHYFMLMGLVANAKAADDAVTLSELVEDLEAMARFSRVARIRTHASAELEQITALLTDMQAKRLGFTGAMVITRAAEPANLH